MQRPVDSVLGFGERKFQFPIALFTIFRKTIDMRFPRSPLLAILLVAFVPSFSIVFSLILSDNERISQAVFFLCKLWIFMVPAIWYLKIDGKPLNFDLPSMNGLVMATATGVGMTSIIVATWLSLGDSIDTQSMIEKLEDTGLTQSKLYIAGTIYWIFINSLLEEYVFRWFITTKWSELLKNDFGAIILSASMFTLHHTLALHFFGFELWQTVMASFGLLSAAAIWSWLYLKYRSIWVCWLSHAICDVAVFGIGYEIIFG